MSQESCLIQVPAVSIAGIRARTSNANEQTANAQIPTLWALYSVDQVANDILNRNPDPATYGVYHQYTNGVEGEYTLTLGVSVVGDLQLSESINIEVVDLQPGVYRVFRAADPVAATATLKAWNMAWDYYANHTETRLFATDFERHHPLHEGQHIVDVYVGIVPELTPTP